MGDKYTITADSLKLAVRFNTEIPETYRQRFNASPTQLLPVITQNSKGLSFFYWGQIPERSNNKALSKKLLYAQREWLSSKKSLSNSMTYHRCLIPADGFYDWKRISKKGRVAHRYLFNNHDTVGVAGLWEEFDDEEGNTHHTFKMIVESAPEEMQTMSGIVPVIIKKEQESIWLGDETDPNALEACFNPFDLQRINIYSVSPKVNDLRSDYPALIEPFAPADQFGNYTLFD